MSWLTTPAHARWLEGETDRLLDFGRASAVPGGGFARQDEQGGAQDGPLELWITCRMTHVYAIGHLLGRPGSAALVDHGLTALRGVFHDDEHVVRLVHPELGHSVAEHVGGVVALGRGRVDDELGRLDAVGGRDVEDELSVPDRHRRPGEVVQLHVAHCGNNFGPWGHGTHRRPLRDWGA